MTTPNETQKQWNFTTGFFKRYADKQYSVRLSGGATYTVCKPMDALGVLRDIPTISDRARGRRNGSPK